MLSSIIETFDNYQNYLSVSIDGSPSYNFNLYKPSVESNILKLETTDKIIFYNLDQVKEITFKKPDLNME